MQSDVFKFVALRPPTAAKPDGQGKGPIVKDPRPPQDTPVGKLVREAGENPGMGLVLPLVKRWVTQNRATPQLPDTDEYAILRTLMLYFGDQQQDFNEAEFAEKVEAILKASPKVLVDSGRLARLQQGLWDLLNAFYIVGRDEPTNLEELLQGLRALYVVDRMGRGERIDCGQRLLELLRATVVLPELLVRVAPAKAGETARAQARLLADQQTKEKYAQLWQKYIELHKTLEEVQALELHAEVVKEVPQVKRNAATDQGNGMSQAAHRVRLVARKETVARLTQPSQEVLRQVGGGAEAVNKPAVIDHLNQELTFLSRQLFNTSDPRLAEVMPEEALRLPGGLALRERLLFQPALAGLPSVSPFPFPWTLKPGVRPLGIGDLKVVKQTLEKYLAGEVAHIENVLKGESKERKFRQFDRTEETITTSQETTEETEKDTQTTDRFELKKETEQTIQTDMRISAGVNVSASYGPVSIGAYANFAYSSSGKDTTKTSANFARDVVDRSLTRIQKKTLQERVTKTIHEIEEIDDHGLNNVGAADHITGVYRWVDKHYKAQVYNYGKRMMFEFIVPEPAAFYIYAQDNDPSKKINLDKPKPLGNVTPKDITEHNYEDYIRDYNVQGITPPPPAYKIVSVALDQSGIAGNATSSKSNKELVVPEGYTAKNWQGGEDDVHFDPVILAIQVGTDDGPPWTGKLSGEDSFVPVAIVTSNVTAYVLNVEIHCERTARAYVVWQIATYEKIAAAYQSALTQYQDKLKAAETARGVVISGHNPGINRQVERTELKKLSLSLLTGEDYSRFAAVSGAPPEVDWTEAAAEGKFIQYFEQAFEWEQITYLFYPYFWGRKNNWPTISNTYDEDPLFTQFLQAGAVRVVVPVRPAYNDAILYYLETGDLWNGGDAPHLNDPLFVSIAEELKDQQDDLGNAVAEGDPWEVIVPTTLVYLQKGPELPDFTV